MNKGRYQQTNDSRDEIFKECERKDQKGENKKLKKIEFKDKHRTKEINKYQNKMVWI
jgi:hypothetical protein